MVLSAVATEILCITNSGSSCSTKIAGVEKNDVIMSTCNNFYRNLFFKKYFKCTGKHSV